MYDSQTDPSEDLHDSSVSRLKQQSLDFLSAQNSTMAHILVHQQQTHRSPSISIHRPTSPSHKEPSLTMAHSVDDRLFLCQHESTRLLNLLTRFASEPQISVYASARERSLKPVDIFALSSSSSVSNAYSPLESSDDPFRFNCDKIQPVLIATNEEKIQPTISSCEPASAVDHDALTSHLLDGDFLLDASPTVADGDTHSERHFRRRKRRSSLTKNSLSLDDTPPAIDAIETGPVKQPQPTAEVTENLDLTLTSSSQPTDDKQEKNRNETDSPVTELQAEGEESKSDSLGRYRGRRLRHRFYRQAASTPSPSQETFCHSPVDFYLPTNALDLEKTRLHSLDPTSPLSLSPPTSPVSLPPRTTPSQASPQKPTTTVNGALKRSNSMGTSKKNVRFADSVGLELTQVQYIRSPLLDESRELSLLVDPSFLSSSPPSFSHTNLYRSHQSRFEHKPWSFDVAPTPKQSVSDTPLPRRFFCLYRQPKSEHPDIYLHEVWKSQIKLEHADIPLYYSPLGEQFLVGTVWVTNASFNKHVSIKYSFNRWVNTCELDARYRCHSNDFRNIDQFEFQIKIPVDVDRIDFVLRYAVNGQEFWDNNDGKNYTVQTESAYTPQTTISLPHDCDFNEMRFY